MFKKSHIWDLFNSQHPIHGKKAGRNKRNLGIIFLVLPCLSLASSCLTDPWFEGFLSSIITGMISVLTGLWANDLLRQSDKQNECLGYVAIGAAMLLFIISGICGQVDKSIIVDLKDFLLPYALGVLGAGFTYLDDLNYNKDK